MKEGGCDEKEKKITIYFVSTTVPTLTRADVILTMIEECLVTMGDGGCRGF